MIMAEVVITAEYTSEDGLIFWTKGWKRNKQYQKVEFDKWGHDSLQEAIDYAKDIIKKGG